MSRYSIGIDLGTTHCAVSYFDLEHQNGRGVQQTMLEIPQVTSVGSVQERALLSSFLYLPLGGEFPDGGLALPWDAARSGWVAGEFARMHGAKSPMRLVSSAKSWLCHAGVDRQAPILPWQAPADVERISPLEASSRYLRHLREAWDHQFESGGQSMADQEVVLTVPASFDAAARDLTLMAARQAGLEKVTLLEEPQAALYSWCEAMGERFRKQVRAGDVLLVVDVGGGTTDFSLMAVQEKEGEVELTRIAVGDHILLGGDNMDLALAHAVNQTFLSQGRKLDSWQFNSLTFACRTAKEQIFGNSHLDRVSLVVPGRGSSLLGGALKAELFREDVHRILADGFCPQIEVRDAPLTARRTGLAQMALPYAQDAAVTRHLAGFLTRQTGALATHRDPGATASFAHPTAVLFNGGVFKSDLLKQRVLQVLNHWLANDGGRPVRELEGAELDLAVARGAAYYGWVRQGHGLRIRGGTARAYYVGIESAMPAVPGMEPPVKALCVAPFGMEEGTQADVPPHQMSGARSITRCRHRARPKTATRLSEQRVLRAASLRPPAGPPRRPPQPAVGWCR